MTKFCPICFGSLTLMFANNYQCQTNNEDHTYEVEYSTNTLHQNKINRVITTRNSFQYQYCDGGSGWVFKINNSQKQYRIGFLDIKPDWDKQAEYYIETAESNYIPCCPVCDGVLAPEQEFANSCVEYCCHNAGCEVGTYSQLFVLNSFIHERILIGKYEIINNLDGSCQLKNHSKTISINYTINFDPGFEQIIENIFKDDGIL